MLVGIITIIDKDNYGNRLQNYALNNYCNNILKISTCTLDNNYLFNNKKNLLYTKCKVYGKRIIKKIIGLEKKKNDSNRLKNFLDFDCNINYYQKKVDANSKFKEFNYLIVGSDQVWNPTFGRLSDVDVLKYVSSKKKISYAASFGVDNIDNTENVLDGIINFKAISVREDSGKKIIEDLTGRKDVEVLVDPTMLLTSKEWDKVSKKPEYFPKKKYILNYFLGNLSDDRKKEIERVAKENNCDIVNIMDKNDPLYVSGPSEFLYLEKHAFLICTDSFHSSVFAILYDRPFIVFNREDSTENMGTRLDTLLSKFKLKNRRYNGKNITKENLEHDYIEAYKILDQERKKSEKFLKKALDIKES